MVAIERLKFKIFVCLLLFVDHAEEVRSIIQRAAKDVAIESSLKTYEEVWLSKIFELRVHTRMKGPSSAAAATQEVNMATKRRSGLRLDSTVVTQMFYVLCSLQIQRHLFSFNLRFTLCHIVCQLVRFTSFCII